MPSFNSKVQLSTAAKNSNTVLSDIDRIKGAFKVYTADEMNAANVNYFTDGQIVYVSDSGSLYKATVTLANPGEGIFEDSVSFSEFSFNSGSFSSASFDDSSNVLTFFGQNLIGSEQISSSVDLSSLSGGGGGSTPSLQQVTTEGNSTDVSMSIQGITIFSATETNGDESGSLFIGAKAAERSTINNSGTNTELNTIIGFDAASATNFLNSRNTVVGASALKGVSGGATNSNNTAIGALSLFGLEDGSGKNTAVGHQSFVHLKSGSQMIAIGNDAGYNILSGSKSIFIGDGSTRTGGSSENEIVIGTNAVGNGDNTVTIGNSDVTNNYFTGNITGSTDIYIAGWGSVSASLAALDSGSASGDITSVVAGVGLSGGASTGDATLTLDTSSTHFINAVNELGLFQETGSVFATTNNIEITGSLEVGGGLFKLTEFTTTPTAEAGAIFYSASNFYFGVE